MWAGARRRSWTILAIGLCLGGCVEQGDTYLDGSLHETYVVGGNARRAVLGWAEWRFLASPPGGSVHILSVESDVVRNEVTIVELADLRMTHMSMPVHSDLASDGDWLVIRDVDAAVLRIHDLRVGADVGEFAVAAPKYCRTLAVAQPWLLMSRDPSAGADVTGRPILLNGVTGEKLGVPQEHVALLPNRLACLGEAGVIVLLDLTDGSTETIGTVSLADPPRFDAAGEWIVWEEVSDAGFRRRRAYNTQERLLETLQEHCLLGEVEDLGDPGLLMVVGPPDGTAEYRLVRLGQPCEETVEWKLDPPVYGRPMFVGPFVVYSGEGGWTFYDTRDGSTRSVDAFGYTRE